MVACKEKLRASDSRIWGPFFYETATYAISWKYLNSRKYIKETIRFMFGIQNYSHVTSLYLGLIAINILKKR